MAFKWALDGTGLFCKNKAEIVGRDGRRRLKAGFGEKSKHSVMEAL